MTIVDRYPYGSLLFLLVDLTSIASATIPLRISCCVVSFNTLYFFPNYFFDEIAQHIYGAPVSMMNFFCLELFVIETNDVEL